MAPVISDLCGSTGGIGLVAYPWSKYQDASATNRLAHKGSKVARVKRSLNREVLRRRAMPCSNPIPFVAKRYDGH